MHSVLLYSLIIVIIVLIILCIVYQVLRPIVVCGDSMFPTLKENDIFFAVRVTKHTEFRVGEIYIYRPPYSNGRKHYVIKRLTRIEPYSKKLYFEGDNKDVSFDSRAYGYISREDVKFRVLV